MKKTAFFSLFLIVALTTTAQHEHHMQQQQGDTVPMSHAFSLNLPMNRNASGTGWLPDASPMYGYSVHTDKWMFMFHGNIFLRYNKQDISEKGQRGAEKFDAPNWFMGMGQRKIGTRGLFRFSTMLSLDPLTIGGEGYPLLFQSGETYQGKRLVDRQHPHDLLSELSVAYTHMISKQVDITAYLGYPGEPAIGPVAFMHRVSAMNNPDAPLGHHWQDATHITFGVATLGVRLGKFKVEASSFTGREPNEIRTDFDKPRFDSYAYRLLYNPNRYLAMQVSRGFLNDPEAAEPGKDVTRTTASAILQLPLQGPHHYLTATFAWGQNQGDHEEHSYLFEPALQLDKTSVYGRYEWIQKSAEELELDQFSSGEEFRIQALTLGVNRVLWRKHHTNIALGLQGTLYLSDNRLDPIYGRDPLAAEIYLRIYPHLMQMRRPAHH